MGKSTRGTFWWRPANEPLSIKSHQPQKDWRTVQKMAIEQQESAHSHSVTDQPITRILI
jgi:hypothetical protein